MQKGKAAQRRAREREAGVPYSDPPRGGKEQEVSHKPSYEGQEPLKTEFDGDPGPGPDSNPGGGLDS